MKRYLKIAFLLPLLLLLHCAESSKGLQARLDAERRLLKEEHDSLQTIHEMSRAHYERLKLEYNERIGGGIIPEDHAEVLLRHRAILSGHQVITTNHASVLLAHREMEKRQREERTSKEVLLREHELMKADHQNMKQDHIAMEQDHSAMTAEIQRLISGLKAKKK